MWAALITLVAAAGCGGAPMDELVPVTRYRDQARAVDTLGSAGMVAAPVPRVWGAIPAVLTELGLSPNFRPRSELRIGACNLRLRGRLGTTPLSDLVDCGATRSLPNADRFDIALTVLVTVAAVTAEATRVHVFVLGVGSDPGGSAADRVWCHSTGRLEQRLRDRLEARVLSGG